MVDIVNTLELIIPKMRGQMYQKKIHSLDVVNEIVKKEGKYFSIEDLDFFFAKIGVYLKSQEVTELLNQSKLIYLSLRIPHIRGNFSLKSLTL